MIAKYRTVQRNTPRNTLTKNRIKHTNKHNDTKTHLIKAPVKKYSKELRK